MVDNYLFCESLIINKLKADIVGLTDITGAASLDSLDKQSPICPCAYVMYAGDAITTTPAATGGISRNVQFVTQIWAVTLCVRLADGVGMGRGMSELAGGFISQINKSLRGFVPAKNCKPMYRHSVPVVADYGDDESFYTIAFCVQFPDI